jgi:hypothetical protein
MSKGFASELFQFMKSRKKLWIVPLILVLLLVSMLIVFLESSAVAPFIYTIF